MNYLAIKHLHVTCVALSGAFFFVRGIWMLRDSALLRQKWVRIVPHVVDAILLASAIALAVLGSQYPLAQGWLTAKVIGLLLYIGLGMIALKSGKTREARLAAFIAALLVFAYIVGIALTRNPAIFG